MIPRPHRSPTCDRQLPAEQYSLSFFRPPSGGLFYICHCGGRCRTGCRCLSNRRSPSVQQGGAGALSSSIDGFPPIYKLAFRSRSAVLPPLWLAIQAVLSGPAGPRRATRALQVECLEPIGFRRAPAIWPAARALVVAGKAAAALDAVGFGLALQSQFRVGAQFIPSRSPARSSACSSS